MAKLQAAGDPAKGGGSLQACHQSFVCVKAPGLLKPWGVPAIPGPYRPVGAQRGWDSPKLHS